MSEYVYAGLTSQTIDIFLQDSSSTAGAGRSGLMFNSSGLVASYRKGATGSRVAITLATQTVGGAYSSGGFVEIDATNMKGVYRLDLPNAAVDTEGFVTLYLYGATNLLPTPMRIDCRPLPVDAKRWNGLTTVALPLVPTTAGRTLDVDAAGAVELDSATVTKIDSILEDTGTTLPALIGGLSGSTVQVASPNVLGNLVLTQGDSYDGIANPKASWTVTTDYTDGWSVALTIRDDDDLVLYTTSGTVVSSTVIAVTIAAPTGLTMDGCPGQWQGKFDVQLTKAGSIKTIALGTCYINEDQTR